MINLINLLKEINKDNNLLDGIDLNKEFPNLYKVASIEEKDGTIRELKEEIKKLAQFLSIINDEDPRIKSEVESELYRLTDSIQYTKLFLDALSEYQN